jgi:hypothetical protein
MAVTWTGADADPTRLSTTEGVVYAGLNKDSSAAVNMAALKAAIAATPVGGTLVIPPVTGGGVYPIDTSGGLTAAAILDKKMTLQIDGTLQASDGAMGANPPYILKVTGDEVTITGKGALKGDGTVDDTNAGDETTFPGLIYVTGDKFTLTLDTIDTPPKVGVLLYDCENALISVPHWKGGVVTYTPGNTAYFGVRTTGGGGHRITGNGFGRDASDGRLISAVFSGGLAGNSDHLIVSNNTADVHEKLAYLYGDYHQVFGNKIKDALQTDVIRLKSADNCHVWGNYGYNVKGGVTVYDGSQNVIEKNYFKKVQQIGVYVARGAGSVYAGPFDGTVIRGNTLIADGTSVVLTDGIRVEIEGSDASDIIVSGNYVQGFGVSAGEGAIRVRAVAPNTLSDAQITENFVADSTRNGIVVDRVTQSEIARNKGRNIDEYFLAEAANSASNRFLDNQGRDITSLGIQGLVASSYGSGNQYTDAALTGTAILSTVGPSHTVTHGGVAANASIFLSPNNNQAATTAATVGYVPAAAALDFTVATGNGSNWVGTEAFRYQIVQ